MAIPELEAEAPTTPTASPSVAEGPASGAAGHPVPTGGGTSLSAQVAKAGSWGIAGRTVLLLANFAATPFTIRLLGPPGYGLWALVQTVFVWAKLAEGGMGVATTKYGSECYAHGDSAGEATIVWSSLGFVLVTTSVMALALALGAHLLLGLLHVRGAMLDAGTWALRLSGAALVFGALGLTVNTAQQVRLRWKQYTFVNTISNLVGCVGVPLAIYLLSGGVAVAAAVGLLAQALYLLGLSWDGVRVQPAYLHPHVDRATLRKLVSYGGVLTLVNLVGIPLLTAERFFLAADASTTAVAYYAVAATVATTLLVIPEQLTSPLLPALARLVSTGKTEELRALYAKSLSGVFLLITPATVLLAFVAGPFLRLWAGPTYGTHATALLLIALVGVWVSAHGWIANAYLFSAAKMKQLALLQAAELVPYIGAAWVCTAEWGAVGAAVAWSARLALDSIARFMIVHRSARLPWMPLSRRRVRSVAAPALLGLGCVGAAELSGSLAVRAGLAAVLLGIYCAGVWRVVLTPSERRGVADLLSEALGHSFSSERRRPAHARRRSVVQRAGRRVQP